jgi:hypothetical protein
MENVDIYVKFLSGYSNDELLKSIDTPEEYECEVYQAILSESLNRELISQEQFEEMSGPGFLVDTSIVEAAEEGLEVNKDDFWKCPKCGQTIEKSFDACWNCQADIPVEVEHPTTKEIIAYQTDRKPFNYVKTGFIAIGTGILILFLSYMRTFTDFAGFHYWPYGRYVIGVIIISVGFVILLKGLLRNGEVKNYR